MNNEIEMRLKSVEKKLDTIHSAILGTATPIVNFQLLDQYIKKHIDDAKKEIIEAIKEGK